MESVPYETSYKVHPDPQDFEESDHSMKDYQRFLYPDQRFQINKPVESGINLCGFDFRQQSNGENAANEATVYQTYGTATQTMPATHQQNQNVEQHSQQRYGHHRVQTHSQQGQDSSKNEETSGFSSSVTEHSDNELSPSEHPRSVDDIKRNIPKSTVFFKMYHGDQAAGENNAEFESNVLHESNSERSPTETGQRVFIHNYIPRQQLENHNHHTTKYMLSKIPEKPGLHPNVFAKGKHHMYSGVSHQSTNLNTLKEYKPNLHNHNFNEQSQTSSEFGREQFKYKSITPYMVQRNHPQELAAHEQGGHLKILHYNNQLSHPGHQTTAIHHTSALYDSAKTLKPYNQPLHHKKHHSSSELRTHSKGLSEFGGQEERQFHQSYNAAKEGEFPSHIQHQLELNVEENNAVPSTISNTVLTQSLIPMKPEFLKSKYHKDLVWKNFNTLKATDLPLVTKPADTFHFEINPFIDIGESSQGSFDHQKALEGSTSFDIKHAIGNANDSGHITSSYSVTPIRDVDKVKQAGDSFVYSSTPRYKVLGATPSLSIASNALQLDSLSSTSQLIHPSVELNTKYFNYPQTVSVLMDHQLKHQEPVTLHFQQPLVKLHLSDEKDFFQNMKTKNSELLFDKQKQHQYKAFRDGNWNNLLQEMQLYQHKKQKNGQHLNLHGRPSQKLFPVFNDNWHIRKVNTRTGKSKRILVKPEVLPHFKTIGKKTFVVKPKKNLKIREVKWKPVGSGGNLIMKTQAKSDTFANRSKENGRHNEFSVTASYTIDRSMKNVSGNENSSEIDV
ncbi:hypothetical protein RUM43_011678 [Polyplax serrata]|uniref:Uncharacterized protein n=1 Tax=Polyplax serrata TaxID=468196 RepID=A0AAN8P9A2_POLSC